MSSADRLDGEPVAASIREAVRDRLRAVEGQGTTPTLGTVLASDDPADERFMALKHDACAEAGIATRGIRVDPAAPARRIEDAVDRLCTDPGVHGVFVQAPLPDHVDSGTVSARMDPRKDVDCFHAENLGRLVGGSPRFVPATPAAVLRLLEWYDVPVEGRDVTVVGRSPVIGLPLANLLLRDASPGNATVTVCHTRTRDLASKTRTADVVVTAAGEPGLVDGGMLAEGAVAIDVSANRLADGSVVGDVAFDSAESVAGAITPVPGGVGPVTIAMLLQNVVLAAERSAGTVSDRPSAET